MSVHSFPKGWCRLSRKKRRRITNTRVWLNGRELRDCFYADARRGVVRIFVRENGHLTLDESRRAPKKTELRGRVHVRVKK